MGVSGSVTTGSLAPDFGLTLESGSVNRPLGVLSDGLVTGVFLSVVLEGTDLVGSRLSGDLAVGDFLGDWDGLVGRADVLSGSLGRSAGLLDLGVLSSGFLPISPFVLGSGRRTSPFIFGLLSGERGFLRGGDRADFLVGLLGSGFFDRVGLVCSGFGVLVGLSGSDSFASL